MDKFGECKSQERTLNLSQLLLNELLRRMKWLRHPIREKFVRTKSKLTFTEIGAAWFRKSGQEYRTFGVHNEQKLESSGLSSKILMLLVSPCDAIALTNEAQKAVSVGWQIFMLPFWELSRKAFGRLGRTGI